MDEMKKRGATPNKSLFRRIAESEFFHNYKHSPSAIVGTVIVVLVLFIALFGPLFAPQNPYDVASLSLTDSYKPPAWEAGGDARFIFGTDSQGRDIFSSLIYGSRISLFIGVVGTLLACAVGITLGLISGYFGGRVDAVIMRLADILLSFPDILVALFIMTMFGRGVADEPVSALDVSIQAQILNILMDLKDEFHFSYLFIAHDLSVVKHISDSLGVMYLGTIVERAPKRLLFSNPVHPYTKALFSSAPTIDEGSIAESQELRGEIPSPIHLPSGCPFHDRCPMACPDCAREVPELKEVEPGHFAACHLL